ncbi:hypothetical protein [Nocardioides daeguensis]|uniref:TOMM leader peptide-binding protein n=1 Tax=Nocardioides daeguensis TaxID=908359 RepID=A0ABP6VTP3_9ACTN|nr:hypothetical protein [Nocardioides daeguensis]MBV6728513.1 hypothetical protein [Nocardioides daeguensis]MCR1773937.1 hypothetical protein [Nocardioides daeguensis]
MASRPHQLRPGTPVLNRSPGVLQVGLTGASLRLPDVPEVRRLLGALASPSGHPDPDPAGAPDAAEALARLRESGLVLPVDPTTPAHLRAQAGPDAVRRQAARAASCVVLDAPPGARTLLEPLLDTAGLRVAAPPRDAAGAGEAGEAGEAGGTAVRLVVADGPVARERLDPLVRASVPHLLVAGDATAVRIGPFVVPGRTACLRCVDAHESLHDERLPLLVTQAARQCVADPPPRDPVLDRLALAWAVRDLARFVDGEEPSTWSATVDLGPAAAPVVTPWGRHPYCGCAWDGFLELP